MTKDIKIEALDNVLSRELEIKDKIKNIDENLKNRLLDKKNALIKGLYTPTIRVEIQDGEELKVILEDQLKDIEAEKEEIILKYKYQEFKKLEDDTSKEIKSLKDSFKEMQELENEVVARRRYILSSFTNLFDFYLHENKIILNEEITIVDKIDLENLFSQELSGKNPEDLRRYLSSNCRGISPLR